MAEVASLRNDIPGNIKEDLAFPENVRLFLKKSDKIPIKEKTKIIPSDENMPSYDSKKNNQRMYMYQG